MNANSVKRSYWPRVLAALALLTAITAGAAAQAQQEDEDGIVANVMQPAFTDENFEQWVFQNQGNAANGRKRIETMLALQTDDADRVCSLSDIQKKKLQLAGRGDIKRFFDRVDEVRKKFQLVKNDQNKFQQIWQDIQPLQTTLSAGLFDDSSIFRKTLRKSLTDEQSAEYDKVEQERRTYRYRAKVEFAVAMLDNGLPLSDDQRQKLVALLVAETKPPKRFGQYDYYVIMVQMGKLPEDKLKPLFDDLQWRMLRPQLNNMRGMEQWLKQTGTLSDGDEAGADKNPQEPATKTE
jgi:hypothetical protein